MTSLEKKFIFGKVPSPQQYIRRRREEGEPRSATNIPYTEQFLVEEEEEEGPGEEGEEGERRHLGVEARPTSTKF